MTHTTSKTSDVPLAVWPCAQRTCQQQRHGRYLPDSSRHPDELLPELARRAIDRYSDPGDLVVDPICGAGTTLIEAVRLDRDAIGVESNARWTHLAAANLERARSGGGPGRARVLSGDGRDLPRILARREARALREPVGSRVARLPHASVDLVLTSLPPMRAATLERYAAAAAVVVKPGGFVVLVIKSRRAGSAVAGEVVERCQRVGLLYWQHVVGLLAEIRGEELIPTTMCDRHSHMRVSHRTCHEDVLVFRREGEPKAGAQR